MQGPDHPHPDDGDEEEKMIPMTDIQELLDEARREASSHMEEYAAGMRNTASMIEEGIHDR